MRAKEMLRLLERRGGGWLVLFLGLTPVSAASLDGPLIEIFMSESLPSTAFASTVLASLILT